MAANDVDRIRQELRDLMQQKTAIEKEVEERSARLNSGAAPGLQGSLVDKEVT